MVTPDLRYREERDLYLAHDDTDRRVTMRMPPHYLPSGVGWEYMIYGRYQERIAHKLRKVKRTT